MRNRQQVLTFKSNPGILGELEATAKRALGIEKKRHTTTLEDAEELSREFHGRDVDDDRGA